MASISECVRGRKEVNYFTLLIRQQCPRYLYTLYILSVSSELGIERGRNRELEAHKKKRRESEKEEKRQLQ